MCKKYIRITVNDNFKTGYTVAGYSASDEDLTKEYNTIIEKLYNTITESKGNISKLNISFLHFPYKEQVNILEDIKDKKYIEIIIERVAKSRRLKQKRVIKSCRVVATSDALTKDSPVEITNNGYVSPSTKELSEKLVKSEYSFKYFSPSNEKLEDLYI